MWLTDRVSRSGSGFHCNGTVRGFVVGGEQVSNEAQCDRLTMAMKWQLYFEIWWHYVNVFVSEKHDLRHLK